VQIDFRAPYIPDFTVVASAGFDQVAVAGTAVSFNDLQSRYGYFGPGVLASPTWDFGDPASGAANTSSGYHTVTHTYSTPGTYTVTLTFVDPFNSSGRPFGSATARVTVLPQGTTAATGTVVPSLFQLQEAITSAQSGAALSAALGGSGAPTPVILDVTPADLPDVVQALQSPTGDPTNQHQVPVILNLTGGSYTDLIANVPPSVNLTVVGNGSTVLVGHSPALYVGPGTTLNLSSVTFQTPTDSPTILVDGGTLVLRNSVIEESTGFADAAIEVRSGTVDLGTAADPGGNTFIVHGSGEFIRNTSGNAIPAIGNTFRIDGTVLTSGYDIEDGITHALDAGGRGLVTFSGGNSFVTPASGSIQRAIDAAPDGSVIHIAQGTYFASDTHSRPLLLTFEGASHLVPVASAGTSDTVVEGQGLTLDATQSLTAGLPVTSTWTVNGHTFDPQSSPRLVLDWQDLQAIGVGDGPGSFAVQVEVIDGQGAVTDSPVVPLRLLNAPPTAFLVNSGTVDPQTPSVVSFTQLAEPSDADRGAGLHYSIALDPAALATSYAAGGTADSRTFTFTAAGDYVVYGRVFDKDGGANDYYTVVHVVQGVSGGGPTGSEGDSGATPPALPPVSLIGLANNRTTIGTFDPETATWYLKNTSAPGAPDIASFRYGGKDWIPVVGDWDGDGVVTIGVVDPTTNTWYLKNSNSPGAPDIAPFRYGAPGWVPVAGDWSGNGRAGIGVFDAATGVWYLRNEASAGAPDAGQFAYGGARLEAGGGGLGRQRHLHRRRRRSCDNGLVLEEHERPGRPRRDAVPLRGHGLELGAGGGGLGRRRPQQHRRDRPRLRHLVPEERQPRGGSGLRPLRLRGARLGAPGRRLVRPRPAPAPGGGRGRDDPGRQPPDGRGTGRDPGRGAGPSAARRGQCPPAGPTVRDAVCDRASRRWCRGAEPTGAGGAGRRGGRARLVRGSDARPGRGVWRQPAGGAGRRAGGGARRSADGGDAGAGAGHGPDR
jgi:PKD repeat protein